jgi:hypothetical protein
MHDSSLSTSEFTLSGPHLASTTAWRPASPRHHSTGLGP